MQNPAPGLDSNPDKAWSAACDGDYMNTIFNKSWLSGQYDTLINQTLILKPDSVFEYTCFITQVDNFSANIAPIFSETLELEEMIVNIGTTRGPRLIVVGYAQEPGVMADALFFTVVLSLLEYIELNFWHSSLGGTGPEIPLDACDAMAQVWQVAKCTNNLPPHYYNASYYGIEDFIEFDPRIHPEPLICDDTFVSQEMIDATNNVDFAYALYDEPIPPGFESYLELTDFFDCASPPIPVGLDYEYMEPVPGPSGVAIGTEAIPLVEYVCPNQGCHYEEGACVP